MPTAVTSAKPSLPSWPQLDQALKSKTDMILYCACVVILTSLAFFMYKSIRFMVRTNKFNEKEMFYPRKLFKGKGSDCSRRSYKPKPSLKPIKEEHNESGDEEDLRSLASSTPSVLQKREYQTGALSRDTFVDGERVQKVVRRNHQERKSTETAEILSAFSTEKSEDYAILPRGYKKPNFREDRDKRVEYFREREKAIFGYEEPDHAEASVHPKKPKTGNAQEKGLKQLEIKFNFVSDSEESDNDECFGADCQKEIKLDGNFRNTVDVSASGYSKGSFFNQNDECISEIEIANSEADDAGNILNQLESLSFHGFCPSDLKTGNRELLMDELMNHGKLDP